MDIILYILLGYLAYYFSALIGITNGYHRYFSHQQFQTSKIAEVVMLYFGILCGGRSALTWSAVHKMHHAYADTPQDPHSARYNPWYVILFSLWRVDRIPRKFIVPLMKNPRVIWFHRYGKYVLVTHWFITFLIFGWPSLIVNTMIYLLAYLGFGILNLWGHDANGPINNLWINLIAPLEGNHKDHHTTLGLK